MDAQASDDRTGVGGWLPYLDEQGKAVPKRSAWFSLEVCHKDFPWVFCQRGRKPSQIISTLEALAVLFSVKLFAAQQPEEQRKRVTILPTWTDNRGNGSVLNKLMTTRYPSSALVMELAAEMKKSNVKAQVEWTPREFSRGGRTSHSQVARPGSCSGYGSGSGESTRSRQAARMSPRSDAEAETAQAGGQAKGPRILGKGRSL